MIGRARRETGTGPQRVTKLRIGPGWAWALAGLAATAAAQPAGGPSPADRAKLEAYKLTIEKVRHYGAADKALYGDAGRDPALKAEVQKMSDEEPQASLADLEAKLVRHPKVDAYYKKEGLTDEEAVVIPLVTMAAMGALQTRAPTGATPEQVQFAKAHQAELQALLDQWAKEDGEDE